MRKLHSLLIALFLFQLSVGQSVNDITYFFGEELNGSARFNAMGGAFGALGGDLSALSLNPAGSSVFLHSEAGVSFNYYNKETVGEYFGTRQNKEYNSLHFDQLGAVLVFNNTDAENPWTRISVGINSHRPSKFNQNGKVVGSNSTGIDNYFLYFADGLPFKNLPLYSDESIKDAYRVLGEENGYGAQQAFLGYQAYLINPLSFQEDETNYYSNVEYQKVNHSLDLSINGLHRKTSFNFSALYKNFLHIGANLNFHKLRYQSSKNFAEDGQSSFSPIYNIQFKNEESSFGQGISAQLGAILKLKNIRLGLAYDSPQYFEINDETRQSLSSTRIDEGRVINELVDPDVLNTYESYQLKLPSKTTLSAAYIFGNRALLSFDYSTQNFANTVLSQQYGSDYLDELTSEFPRRFNAVQTLKIGGEFRFNDISLRGGILNRMSPQKIISINEQAISFGIGLDFGSNALNFSLVRFNESKAFEMFSAGLKDSYTLSNAITLVGVSYNIKL
jgi:hypothetical protein